MKMPTAPKTESVAMSKFPLSRRLTAGLAVGIGALFLCLIVLEYAARVVLDGNGMHYGIEMWKYARLVKQRSSNPLMSHEHAPNREARLMGVDVTTGSQGLRDRDYPFEKGAREHRILVLGDSLTFGWGVPVERTYPKALERMLNSGASSETVYQVINAGVGNYNTVQEVSYFKERGIRYRPDEVILGFYINDAEPIPTPQDGWLARTSYLYVLASSGWDSFLRNFGAKVGYADYYRDLYTEQNAGWQACQRALEELIEMCQRQQIPLRIVLLPELHFPNGEYPFASIHDLVAAVGKRHGVATLDLQRAFTGHDPKSLWVSLGDAHPNEKAMDIIATEIYRAMSEKRSTTSDLQMLSASKVDERALHAR
jgi:lysophospholipase L1-like esterase